MTTLRIDGVGLVGLSVGLMGKGGLWMVSLIPHRIPPVRSRNQRNAPNTTPMPATSTTSTPLNVPPLHRSNVREPSSPPVARRAGAVLRMKHNGQSGVWLSRNAFCRLSTARDQADKKLKGPISGCNDSTNARPNSCDALHLRFCLCVAFQHARFHMF